MPIKTGTVAERMTPEKRGVMVRALKMIHASAEGDFCASHAGTFAHLISCQLSVIDALMDGASTAEEIGTHQDTHMLNLKGPATYLRTIFPHIGLAAAVKIADDLDAKAKPSDLGKILQLFGNDQAGARDQEVGN